MSKRKSEQLNEIDNEMHTLKRRREDTVKLPKIFDGSYYEVVEHDKDNKSISAKCMKCIKSKVIRGQSSSTGNFYQHYMRTHPDEHKAMKEYCDEKLDKKVERKAISSKVQSILPFSTGSVDPSKVI